jgi:hypothetical protein
MEICGDLSESQSQILPAQSDRADPGPPHGGAEFQSRYDKTTAQAQEMKEGVLRVM